MATALPPDFHEDRLSVLHAAIRQARLATLVTLGAEGPEASHLPLLLDAEEGPKGSLYGHLARANPQWRTAVRTVQALAIFTGPEAYVSPSWYATKATTGNRADVWPEKACFKTSLLGRAVPRGVGWQGAWGDRRRQPGERWCPLPR